MKLWYLDNEHTDYLVVAETREVAWRKLEKFHILPYETPQEVADDNGDDVAYNDIYELDDDMMLDNLNDVQVVL